MIETVKMETEEKMAKSISSLRSEYGAIRAGRANPSILDRINVEYYGAPTPLNQLSNISSPDPRMLVIQPFDASSIGDIERAILKSDLGLNPTNDGKIIRLVFPQLTEERRKDLSKLVKKYGEECKIAIRNIRRQSNDELKKAEKESLITEDELRNGQGEIQKLTDDYSKKVDEIIEEKIAEIMEV